LPYNAKTNEEIAEEVQATNIANEAIERLGSGYPWEGEKDFSKLTPAEKTVKYVLEETGYFKLPDRGLVNQIAAESNENKIRNLIQESGLDERGMILMGKAVKQMAEQRNQEKSKLGFLKKGIFGNN
jgi:hypothetical protein